MSRISVSTFFGIPLLMALYLCQVEGVRIRRIIVDPQDVKNEKVASRLFGLVPEQDDSLCKEAGGQAALAVKAFTINGITENCILCKVQGFPNHPFLMYYDETNGEWIKVEYSCPS